MKPLLLSIQAFGPFAGNESVDFTALGRNPLFLINGATGAGKSTILDAICFALYGQTTGAEREASQMRCDYAAPALLSEVSLEFGLGDKYYRIRRVPQQEKPKTRGEGTTIHAPEAQLWELDGTDEGKLLVPKKVGEATAMVQDLIGLDVEQFRQVMVLPQGKFRELLLADSTDRQKIFSQLFQASIYKRIEERLKYKASGIKQAVDDHQNQIRGILQAAEVNTEQEVVDSLQTLVLDLKATKAARDKADKEKRAAELHQEQAVQLNKRFEDLAQKQTQLTALQEREPEIKIQRQSLEQSLDARNIQPVYQIAQTEAAAQTRLQVDQATSSVQLSDAEKALLNAEKALTLAKTNAKALNALNKEKLELDQLQAQSEQLTQAWVSLERANSALVVSAEQLASLKKNQADLDKEQQSCDSTIKALQKALAALPEQQIALSKLAAQLERREELDAVHQQEVGGIEAEAAAKRHYASTEQVFEKAAEKATKTEMSWHAGQAALLARELKDAEPCSVCGSADHPAPAKNTDLVEKAAVDIARDAESDARQAMEQAKQSEDKATNTLVSIRKESQRLTSKLGQLAEQPLQKVAETCRNEQLAVEKLLAKQEQQQQLADRTEAIKAELQTIKTDSDKASLQVDQDKEQQVKVSTMVEQLLSVIPEGLRETGALTEKIGHVDAQISQLTKALEAAEKDQVDARSASDKVSSHHKAVEKQLLDQTEKASVTAEAWKDALNKSPFASDQHFQQAILPEDEQEALKVTLQQWQSDLDAVNGVLKQLQQDVADKVAPDFEVVELDLTETTKAFQKSDESWRTLEARNKQLKDIQKKLDEAHKKNAALEAEYQVIGTLSEVANGQTGNKISLQRFVLSVLLDDVLIQASQRLTLMSKGRYQLVRKEDRAKGNKASGLELEVEDGYTGKTRSVATLSGGESFLAALSLALGLSDVVQSYAGGIKLDTLFIDEGFGSLDPESLDLAVRTLIDLQASGRMIGIISHVSELKEQMALRVDVVSGRAGSSIATVAS